MRVPAGGYLTSYLSPSDVAGYKITTSKEAKTFMSPTDFSCPKYNDIVGIYDAYQLKDLTFTSQLYQYFNSLFVSKMDQSWFLDGYVSSKNILT